ncbi:putative bifunctional diguanylate cyclase/phosphodiesterase [Pseudomonas matsuisoli]|uniref:Bifunctional diguanylate cyclase/phosphodiesterase n=1 Tax=Pseudomonas matsuisoli TaxID=1515666 RepID=A0A917PT41_9PSED|nr:EAL domain-containing protein [Pseudomonas matsuisoli]GGJ90241.1 bifunctional diguanylate cyclase/phosphodiesterase [Pseudomonas matsuisoli]
MEVQSLGALFALTTDGRTLYGFRHDYRWLMFALLIITAAAYSYFGMVERIRKATGDVPRRVLWQSLSTLNLAGGIWAMNVVAILSVQTPATTAYDLSRTNISILPALIGSGGIVLCMSNVAARQRLRTGMTTLLLAITACAVHHSALSALDLAAPLRLEAGWIVASLAISIAVGYLALTVAAGLNDDIEKRHWQRFAAALLLGTAIVALHYCGIEARSIALLGNVAPQWQPANDRAQLSGAIGIITLLLMVTAVLTERIDRRLQHRNDDLHRMRALLKRLDRPDDVLHMAAHQDPLTQLLNRRGLETVFEERLLEHRASGHPLALMFLDIDHFKRINDSLGHDAGDQLLKVIAQRVRGELRDGDSIARFGGDEFCILVPVEHEEEARGLARRVMQKMKEPISLSGRNLVMTTSIGISFFPDHGNTPEELMKHADLALYQSKEAGRDGVHLFDNELKQRAQSDLRLEQELRQALANDTDLELHYQPVVPIDGGAPVQLEALIRWNHPRYGMIAAERFIGIAEASGFIGELDTWAVNRACHDLIELTNKGHTRIQVAINCSALNFADEELPKTLEVALRRSGVSPLRLNVEITEDAVTSHVQRAVKLLKKIYRLGVSISIDNFGTGYSSLPYLKRLPLELVKIDRAFTGELTVANESQEIVHAIIAMAHAMQLKVVAEGVETSEQLQCLQGLGCDLVQGHLISAPLGMPALLRYLERPHARGHTILTGSDLP